LKQIADKLDVKVSLLLTLNKPRYKGLTSNAKLQEGTSIVVPVSKGTQPKSSKKQKRTPETPIIDIPEEATKDYSAVEDETLKQIAAKINVDVSILLTLNKPRYKGLTTAAKLQEGTLIAYPASHELPAPVVEEELETLPWSISHDAKEVYLAKDNETLKQIASKLHVDVEELLKLNQEKYSGLSIHAKLQRGTVILTPCCESAAGSSDGKLTHKAVVVGNTQAANGEMFNWTVFVKGMDHSTAPSGVDSVTFHLHPDFKPKSVKITEPPFQLSRSGWGSFDVGVEIKTSDGIIVEIDHGLELNDAFSVQHVALKP